MYSSDNLINIKVSMFGCIILHNHAKIGWAYMAVISQNYSLTTGYEHILCVLIYGKW